MILPTLTQFLVGADSEVSSTLYKITKTWEILQKWSNLTNLTSTNLANLTPRGANLRLVG